MIDPADMARQIELEVIAAETQELERAVRNFLDEEPLAVLVDVAEPSYTRHLAASISETAKAMRTHRAEYHAAIVEMCAKVAEAYEPRCESCPRGVAAAIRALK